jgi:protein disulfide-isomerase
MKKIITCFALLLTASLIAAPNGFIEKYDDALTKAQKENKLVFALFTGSDWCPWCVYLEKEVTSQKDFIKSASKKFVLLFLDFPRDKSKVSEEIAAQNRELASKYAVRGFPTVLILDADGNQVGKTGYRRGGAKPYIEHLEELAKEAKKNSRRQKLKDKMSK